MKRHSWKNPSRIQFLRQLSDGKNLCSRPYQGAAVGRETYADRLDDPCRRCGGAASVAEYRRFRVEDAETIKRLGVKVKNLEAAARHEIEVAGPIDAAVKDTVVIRDTLPQVRQKVEMITPHIRLTGLIENNRLKGEIRVPVTLNQAVWVEYRGWWLWKRVKAIHQTVSSDNPYVDIKYSEYIQITGK